MFHVKHYSLSVVIGGLDATPTVLASEPSCYHPAHMRFRCAAANSCDGLAGSQHLDTPVRTQDLTGHPGHQRLFTTPDVSRETSIAGRIAHAACATSCASC